MEAWDRASGEQADIERVHEQPRHRGPDWGSLLTRYAPLALRLARGIVPHGDQAEDVVQEAARAVLERAVSRAESFVSAEHARNYFLRAVHTRALDVVRASARERVASPEGGEAPEPVDRVRPMALHEHETEEREACSLRNERLRRGLEDLRPAEQEALRLRYLEGLAYREIAERTGESISTLHTRVEAGLEKLRRRMSRG